MAEKTFKITVRDIADTPTDDFTVETLKPYLSDCLEDIFLEITNMEDISAEPHNPYDPITGGL